MNHGDLTGCQEPTDLSSIDSQSEFNGKNALYERHELASGVVYYHGDTTREWIRHDGSLDVEVRR